MNALSLCTIAPQSKHYTTMKCTEMVADLENRYRILDEREFFGTLVNFSTAKEEPYQRWVRYREGYSTKLVDELIERAHIDSNHHFIADPMVGSGSTLISAARNGFSAFGIDVNPYCRLIITTKLLRPIPSDLDMVQSFVASLNHDVSGSIDNQRLLADYFPQDNLQALLSIERQILTLSDSTAKQILLASWFFILESCSNRKKDGNGLATRQSPVVNVFDHYINTVESVLSDYDKAPLPNKANCTVYTGSATSFAMYSSMFSSSVGKELGAVIFSPPYANSFDYFESYKLELLFGNFFTWSDFKEAKKQLIRNYRISHREKYVSPYELVEILCNEVELAIPKKEQMTGKHDGRTRLMPNMLRSYFSDMGDVLQQIFAAMPEDCHCYIVVDQSAYVGVIIPTDVVLADIAEKIGFTVESISVCRRATTSAQQLHMYPYLRDSLRESIVALIK